MQPVPPLGVTTPAVPQMPNGPQFHFPMPSRIVRPLVIIADNKCYTLRSYVFTNDGHASGVPHLKSYSTCTPARPDMKPTNPGAAEK